MTLSRPVRKITGIRAWRRTSYLDQFSSGILAHGDTEPSRGLVPTAQPVLIC